jgi:hypothetical protein
MFRYTHQRFLIVSLLFSAVFSVLSGETVLGQLMEGTDTPPAVSVPPDVLWDQTAGIASTDISSQDFTDGGGVLDHFDTRAADDFQVPGGFFWIIQTVYAFGAFDDTTPDIINSLNVYFFTDKDGLPDTLHTPCVYKDIVPEDITVPNFVVDLPSPCKLEPGIYWVSVQANIGFIQNGQWFWHENSVQRLSPFVWENPGDGFSTGCVQFTPAQADCDADSPDLSFQLAGLEIPAVRPIPTLSEWGMISTAFILGMIGIGAFIIMRKKASKA